MGSLQNGLSYTLQWRPIINSTDQLWLGDFSVVACADTLFEPGQTRGSDLFRKPENMAAFTALFRSAMFWMVLVCVLMGTGTGEVLAQAPAAPAGGTTTVVVQGRGLALEWIITIAMCGVALFVVCRSSRRN